MDALVVSSPQGDLTAAKVPVPTIDADELLVRIRAVGVGIHDSTFLPRQLVLPYPIGIEAAGVVEEAGFAASGYGVGDRIAFVSMMQPKGGVWAEYAAVRADSLILPVPDGMGFEDAAAIPVAGNSALRALHALPATPPGGAIFVAGASGAVGTFAVQLARERGWEVAASASTPNHDYLRSLGATLTVDYRDPQWTEQVRRWRPEGLDGAVAVQPRTTAPCMGLVKAGGTVVTVSGDQVAPAHGVRVSGLAYGADVREELLAVMDRIARGEFILAIERVFPFTDALAALAKVQTRRARGKVVISLG
ncbi:NADP-dependent oxidoreductase [Georgenia satyanarayanai]|uniref:NADP-dependent oxidoreductase n=1 Tax=Georgenia satyanarayanai TaxID=860221 RepID=UPI00203A9265|nr:NADP-dependent oxidoreductase [Georgenia satyanarayanai]MCM3659765.1 NADP-dependent oxidoreductase [Georgenia satyanarayanai]